MVQFLYTGEIISDSIEASKEVLRILVDVLKFPSECDVTRYIECPMWDCGEHVDSLDLFDHFLEDVTNEIGNKAKEIEYNRKVICSFCKEVINYIGESEETNRNNVWLHYLNHEEDLQGYVHQSCGFKPDKNFRDLKNNLIESTLNSKVNVMVLTKRLDIRNALVSLSCGEEKKRKKNTFFSG